MKTILLLVASNIFMTLAWYGHLKFKFLEGKSLLLVILVSWGIAFFEYCLMVPANRSGYLSGEFSGYQLKIIQECLRPGQQVFVGVVAPINPRIDTPEEVRDRVIEAAKYIPIEQMGTTDDCGYAPFSDDTSTSRETAFAKIRARVEGTAMASDIIAGG